MSIFLCRAVATRAAFAETPAHAAGPSERDLFEAKGRALSRQVRRGRFAPKKGLTSLAVAPLAFLAAMTVNQALAAPAPEAGMVAAHTCSAAVPDMTRAVIAQSGKTRQIEGGAAILPASVVQTDKVRPETVPALATVSYVRCLHGST